MKGAGDDGRSVLALNEPSKKVRRLLSVGDAGEVGIVAFDEHARMQQHLDEEPSLPLGEPGRRECLRPFVGGPLIVQTSGSRPALRLAGLPLARARHARQADVLVLVLGAGAAGWGWGLAAGGWAPPFQYGLRPCMFPVGR